MPQYSRVMDMVREFKKVTQQNPTPDMSRRLVTEEYVEWFQEADWSDGVPHNRERELKELADLVYVIYGYADTMGYDLDIALNRVHKNNLERVIQPDGSVQFREDGKALKRKDAPKVYLGGLV